jgi:hypothetical protein
MRKQKRRLLVVACVLAAMMLAAPTEGRAACALLDWLSGGSNAKTTYAPPYAAPVAYVPAAAATSGCAPCTQTVQYVPQTSYRAAYVAVPVTAYQPVVTADPCTGCAVTTYRPVAAVTYQTRLVPYTSYRMVYANPCTPCASYSYAPSYDPCTTCGPASYARPMSSCGPCAGAPTSAPYTDQPVTGADRTPSLGPTPPGTLTPKPDPSSSKPDTGPGRTFQNDERSAPSKSTERYPVPVETPRAEKPSSAPATIGPEIIPDAGRTTQRVLPTVTPIGMSSAPLPLEPVKKPAAIEAPWQPAIN